MRILPLRRTPARDADACDYERAPAQSESGRSGRTAECVQSCAEETLPMTVITNVDDLRVLAKQRGPRAPKDDPPR
jgi:hypothetical protein